MDSSSFLAGAGAGRAQATSLVSLLDDSARAFPDKVALRFRGRSFTYAELRGRVDRLAGALASLGVRQGDHVAFVGPNSAAAVEAPFACARLGAVCEKHNVRLPATMIARLLARSGARVALVAEGLCAPLAASAREEGWPLKILTVGDEGCCPGRGTRPHGGVEDYETFAETADPVCEGPGVAPDDGALLLYTSGTTDLPKGVLLSHGALLARVAIDERAMQFAHDDVYFCVLPLYHVTSVTALLTLAVGAELVIAASSRPEAVVRGLSASRATCTALVPCLLRSVADEVERSGLHPDALRLVVYGGEPLGPSLLERCLRLIPCDYLQGYGMTETAAAITLLSAEHHRDPQRLASVGRAVEGVEVCIVDERGSELAPGVLGEVAARTPTLMSGYLHDPARTADAIHGGRYLTGDIGFLDDDGFLTLVDRKKNLVITGGENVYPQEVAHCLQAVDGVADVAVVGVPDARWGETLAAFVVRSPGSDVTAEGLAAHCARELGGYKKPRHVRFVNDVGRSPSGKIPRERLAELKRLIGAEGPLAEQ